MKILMPFAVSTMTCALFLAAPFLGSHPAASAATTEKILGFIDGGPAVGSPTVGGWARVFGSAASITVNIYAGGPVGMGTLLGNYPAANISSDVTDKANACGTQGSGAKYRYKVTISGPLLQAHAGQLIYAYGVAPDGTMA